MHHQQKSRPNRWNDFGRTEKESPRWALIAKFHLSKKKNMTETNGNLSRKTCDPKLALHANISLFIIAEEEMWTKRIPYEAQNQWCVSAWQKEIPPIMQTSGWDGTGAKYFKGDHFICC